MLLNPTSFKLKLLQVLHFARSTIQFHGCQMTNIDLISLFGLTPCVDIPVWYRQGLLIYKVLIAGFEENFLI